MLGKLHTCVSRASGGAIAPSSRRRSVACMGVAALRIRVVSSARSLKLVEDRQMSSGCNWKESRQPCGLNGVIKRETEDRRPVGQHLANGMRDVRRHPCCWSDICAIGPTDGVIKREGAKWE